MMRKPAPQAIAYAVAAGLLAGCAPLIHVENRTQFPVRADIAQSRGGMIYETHDVILILPGRASSVVGFERDYVVSARSDAEWVAALKSLRAELLSRLAHPEYLTAADIRSITQRLSELSKQRPGENFCHGRRGNNEDDVFVRINGRPGAFVLTCQNTPPK